MSAWWNETPGTQWESPSLEVVIGVFTRWRNPLTLLSDNWEITYSAKSVNKCLSFGINSLVTCMILLVNHVSILVRTDIITLWMKILVSQTVTIARRHAIRQQKKLVHSFATDLKATGPAGQHKMNCCGPNWPDDLNNACGPAGT